MERDVLRKPDATKLDDDETTSNHSELTMQESSTSDLERSRAFSPEPEHEISAAALAVRIRQGQEELACSINAVRELVDDIDTSPSGQRRDNAESDSDGSSDTLGDGNIPFSEFGGRQGSLMEELREADANNYATLKRLQFVEEQKKNLLPQLRSLKARLRATEHQRVVEQHQKEIELEKKDQEIAELKERVRQLEGYRWKR